MHEPRAYLITSQRLSVEQKTAFHEGNLVTYKMIRCYINEIVICVAMGVTKAQNGVDLSLFLSVGDTVATGYGLIGNWATN